jgi:hypothetical protein
MALQEQELAEQVQEGDANAKGYTRIFKINKWKEWVWIDNSGFGSITGNRRKLWPGRRVWLWRGGGVPAIGKYICRLAE